MKTGPAIVILAGLLMIAVGATVSNDASKAKADAQRIREDEAMRAQYTATRFCPKCNGPHWLPTAGAPKPCPICNPRGSLEVLD